VGAPGNVVFVTWDSNLEQQIFKSDPRQSYPEHSDMDVSLSRCSKLLKLLGSPMRKTWRQESAFPDGRPPMALRPGAPFFAQRRAG